MVITTTEIKNISIDFKIAATSSSSVKSKYKRTAKNVATIHKTSALTLRINLTKNGSSSIKYFSKP